MHRDYTKICRVCMSDGSRDIFLKASTDGSVTATTAKIATPLERLLEKLRYITMMKIEENDDLPRLLCDLCIVQLNVAYNFKRQAVENDTKLRQYFIENGITSNQPVAMNEVSSVRSSFAASNISQAHPNFPIIPLIVKTEPNDIDTFSDVTTETNVDIDNRNNFQSATSNAASSPEESVRRTNEPIYINDINPSSMVYVNRGYEFNSVTPSSDIEFVQNYQINTTNDHSNKRKKLQTIATSTPTNKSFSTPVSRKEKTLSQRSQTKPNGIQKIKLNMEGQRKTAKTTSGRIARREMKNLAIDMVPGAIKSPLPKENRRSSGKTKRVLPRDNKTTASPTTNPLLTKIKTTNSPVPTKRLPTSSSSSTVKLSTSNSSMKTTSSSSPPNKIAKKTTDNFIVLNPFNSTKTTNKLKQRTAAAASTKSKPENRLKRKTAEKLLRPKIEPPTTKKN